MSQIKRLTGYSLKLADEDKKAIKLAAASVYSYLYEWCDEAVKWATDNKESILPLVNKRDGSYRSYYLNQTNEKLMELEIFWGCSATRALYTAVIGYLNQPQTSLHKQLMPD